VKVQADHPIAGIVRQLIVGERVVVGRMRLEEGFHREPHVHHHEQISIVLEGRLGEVMVLPPYVPHGATALEPSLVLDLFSPPSEKTGIDHD
jgi:quercetin dioxygenase-like cupin family protein